MPRVKGTEELDAAQNRSRKAITDFCHLEKGIDVVYVAIIQRVYNGTMYQ